MPQELPNENTSGVVERLKTQDLRKLQNMKSISKFHRMKNGKRF